MHLLYHQRRRFAITSRVFAVYKYPNNGRKADKEKTKYFKLNDQVEVADMKVEKTTTYVMLNGQWYNSVQFDYIDSDGNTADIYTDWKYNPYLQYKLAL